MGAVAVVREGAEVTENSGVLHCLMCGCDRDDHFEPDPYDMGNAELDASGHLNHCGDCAQCFGPEYQRGEKTQ